MIYAAPAQSFEATLVGAPTGLVGSLGVRILDGVGGVTLARTTAGIVEALAGSGTYVATLTAPTTAGQYVVLFDTGVVSPSTTAAEELVVTSSAPGFVPATGWAPNYASLVDLKAAVGIDDTDDDTELGYALAAASRAVDNHTGRQFGLIAAPAVRYYSAFYDIERRRWVVRIDDLMSTTGLVVRTDDGSEAFTTTLAADTDYRLAPYNAAGDGRPWTSLVAANGGALSRNPRTVEVTARWGWSSVPAEVVQATLLQAGRLFKRKDAPFGIAGSPELGSELRLLDRVDPDVALLLSGLRRHRLLI